jgi:peptidoglycan/xylan/chitin deacetylase (PgdA/CDA1 family)
LLAIPADGDVSRAVGLRTRLSHRLARLVPASPVNLSLETPLVSFTFDDAPVCACTVGADLLEAYDAKGTFYIAGGLLGEHTPHWRVADDALIAALHGRGHEIGDHTYSHVFVPNFSGEALEAEADRNRQRLRAIVPGL